METSRPRSGRRRDFWRSFERIWRHVAALQARAEEEQLREREAALPLLNELFRLPAGRQREVAAAEPRFHSLGLAALLLESAEDSAGLFEESAAWLERARHNPDLPLPPRDSGRATLLWDDLGRTARRKVCARIGFPQDVSLRPAAALEPAVRDVMTWLHEALTHIRIDFEVAG